MKKVTTAVGVFGPYTTIETLDDRYRCDGADLPFTVVGEGVVGDWTDADAIPVEPPKPDVPQTITIRQAKLVLHGAGLLDDVDAAVAQADKATQLEWEYATEVKRDWPTLLAMATALGMTDAQLDSLFVEGAKL